jgi:hypothetical protein
MIAFTPAARLRLDYIDGLRWRLAAPFWFVYSGPEGKCEAHVPVGFEHDFSSIPRVFWRIVAPTEYGPAGVIHDWAYRSHCLSRAAADHAYLLALEALGCPAWKRQSMYRAVRAFGGRAYDKHSAFGLNADV